MSKNVICIRPLDEHDPKVISNSFLQQGCDKVVDQYSNYLLEQNNGKRYVLVAEVDKEFAGYLTIVWNSSYPPFFQKKIPEIVDLNVLKKFQRKGIASALMNEAERVISKASTNAGIGVGIVEDYGPAQVLYIKRGYIPDGNGMMNDLKPVKLGDSILVNHSQAFYLTKQL